MGGHTIPGATYRLQLNERFTFDDARAIVGYLRRLGITTVYTSPIFTARRGSTHGYDVVDARAINPELGGQEAFERFSEALREAGLGLLVDIVPNHMAASPENAWWMDLLEFGQESRFANYFDVVWEPVGSFGATRNRLLLPILGKPYGEALESQEIRLAFEQGAFSIHYYERRVPISPRTYARITSAILQECVNSDDAWCRELTELTSPAFWDGASEADPVFRRSAELKKRLAALAEREPEFRNALEQTVATLNGVPGEPSSFDELDQLLDSQPYRLAYWRMASEEINYRRFFDVTDLVGVRIEEQDVFEARHERLFELIRAEKISGLRIDHIDGLYDPVSYLRRLQAKVAGEGSRFYVIVEKILAPEEELPDTFATDGTTGYDFLNVANSLFIDRDRLERMSQLYEGFIGQPADFERIAYESKKSVIDGLFAGEMRALAATLARLASYDRNARDYAFPELLSALTEVTASLSVYRTYVRDFHVSPRDEKYIDAAVAKARARSARRLDARLFDFVRRALLVQPPQYLSNRREWLDFVQQWQQFTGRAMAKGVEDTAFYVYNRLISMNEVGGEPAHDPGDAIDAFHRWNEKQLRSWPNTMNTLSTHDTKRSEDVRARINVLSEIPDAWEARLRRWARLNHASKREVGGTLAPDRNEEILIYQTLVGAWPPRREQRDEFRVRMLQFIEKALRESKVHTSWIDINAEYESGVKEFIDALFANDEFVEDLDEFVRTVASYGFLNSLSQTVLKTTSPGVPDWYQGSELWDFSLVDPDNRRDVDYAARVALLDRVEALADPRELLGGEWTDGALKLFVVQKLLRLRAEHPTVFREGSYERLQASGDADRHVVAFLRRTKTAAVVVAVPRLLTGLLDPGEVRLAEVWKDHRLMLSPSMPRSWTNICTQNEVLSQALGAGEHAIPLAELFRDFPVAVLVTSA